MNRWDPPRTDARPGVYRSGSEAALKLGCTLFVLLALVGCCVLFALFVLWVGRHLV